MNIVRAIMQASGITKEQAKTCFYYCLATYLLPDKIKKMPILLIIGPHGTGKSSLLKQLFDLVNEPTLITAESIPTLRDKLVNSTTAIIDEGDEIIEDYLIKRYDEATANISFKRTAKGGWKTVNKNIFGATIIARRTPFKDSATASRSIVIRTRFRAANYKNTESLDRFTDKFLKVAKIASRKQTPQSTNRINDNWAVLRIIAETLKDTEWLKYCEGEIEESIKTFRGSQNYEPEIALLLVLKERMINLVVGETVVNTKDVLLSTIRSDLKSEFDVHLKNVQIQEICRALGFKIVSHSGYPKIKHNRKLLDALLKDREV